MNDQFVIWTLAKPLADIGGVDTLSFDTTNALKYGNVQSKKKELDNVYLDTRSKSMHTPKFCFIIHGHEVNKQFKKLQKISLVKICI